MKCGDLINNKYVLLKLLGGGTFAHVWLCYDVINYHFYALKIQIDYYYENGIEEVKISNRVQELKCKYLHTYIDNFIHLNEEENQCVCTISNIMAGSLYDIMKRTKYHHGFPIQFVGKVISQILMGLNKLHTVLHWIHTDIKPENILLSGTFGKVKELINLIGNHNFKNPAETRRRKDLSKKSKNIQFTVNSIKDILISTNQKQDKISEEQEETDSCSTASDISSDHDITVDSEIISSDSSSDDESEDDSDNESDKLILDHYEEIDEILIQNPEVKLSDFGNSISSKKKKKGDIQTRYYRAPEIILRCKYNETSDIWSLGCTIYELLTGKMLFNPDKKPGFNRDRDHLYLIQTVLGPIPNEIINDSRKKDVFFKKNNLIKGVNCLEHRSLKDLINKKTGFPIDAQELDDLIDFLNHMFDYNVQDRYDTKKCLEHKWIKKYRPYIENSKHDNSGLLSQKIINV